MKLHTKNKNKKGSLECLSGTLGRKKLDESLGLNHRVLHGVTYGEQAGNQALLPKKCLLIIILLYWRRISVL